MATVGRVRSFGLALLATAATTSCLLFLAGAAHLITVRLRWPDYDASLCMAAKLTLRLPAFFSVSPCTIPLGPKWLQVVVNDMANGVTIVTALTVLAVVSALLSAATVATWRRGRRAAAPPA
jgi:hypothetical protein